MAAQSINSADDSGFFWHIYNEARDPILLSQDGGFLDCNQAALTQLGLRDKAELRHLTLISISPPLQPDGRASAEKLTEVSELIAQAGYHRFEWACKRVDGSLFDVEVTATVITINGEQVIHAHWRDIGEQKRLARELHESQEAARKIFDEAADPVILFKQSIAVDCNKAALQQLGFHHKQDLLGLSPQDIAPPVQESGQRTADRQTEVTATAIRDGKTSFEWLLKRADGSLIETEVTLTTITVHGEEMRHMRWRDIGEQKRLARELHESQEAARKIFDEAADPVILYEQGVAIDCNKAALQQLGFHRKQDLLGLSPEDISPPVQENGQQTKDRKEEVIATALRHGKTGFDWLLKRADGSLIETEITLTAITVHGADVLHIRWRDISEQKRLAKDLRESEESFRRIFDEAAAPLMIIKKDGRIFDSNQAAVRLFGYPSKQLLAGKSPTEMALPWQPDGRASTQMAQEMIAITLHKGYHHFGWQMRCMDGSLVDTEITLTRITVHGEALIHAQIRDLTEQNRLRAALYAEKERAEITLASIGDAVITTDAEGRVTFLNHVASKLTGWLPSEAIGQSMAEVFHIVNEATRARVVSPVDEVLQNGKTVNLANHTVLVARDGKEYNIEDSAAPIFLRDGTLLGCVLVFHDVSEKHQLLKSVRWQAGHDVLTGLPNRVLLADRFQRALANARRQKNLLGVCLMDLDQFKPVNDLYGHDMGDRLLIEVTGRINQAVRSEDTVARLGGDEFAMLLGGLADRQQLELVLRRILETVSAPYVIGEHTISISASIGVAIYPLDEVDADTLLRHADQAMYLAKQAGRNRFHWFDVAHDRQAQTSQQTLARIREALQSDELCLHYQPKVNMRSGKVVGMEALLRWQHPQQGLLPPLDFLPLAEQTDLIVDIGEWVIEQALKQGKAWLVAGKNWPISVNIAARHFQLPDFLDRLKIILARHPDVPPQQLEIEILESVALGDMHHVQQLILACQALSIKFSLDDFGTGYSSLSYLKRLPADTLKIDQSFVRDMLDDKDDLALIEAVIGLASAFNRKVVAEGVETIEHGVLLMRLGCDIAQGYGIARPMPTVQIIDWAEQFTPDPKWRQWANVQWDMRDIPLLMAEHDHLVWVKHVLKTVAEGTPLQQLTRGQLTDHHLCRFGLWYDGDGQARYGQLAEFIAIEPIHAQVHQTGTEIIHLHEAGQVEAAHTQCNTLLALKTQLVESLGALQLITTETGVTSFSLPHEGPEMY
ncbi:MAG: EAL domain-containing protein [Rugosibacter sp.]|nr:MAG: EAL domain-containing protein [Rugosibacter sp.]